MPSEREKLEDVRQLFEDADLWMLDGLPASLAKAMQDSWHYVAKLRTGEVIRFESADRTDEDWIHLGIDNIDGHAVRGLDVRISDIVWVADCEDG